MKRQDLQHYHLPKGLAVSLISIADHVKTKKEFFIYLLIMAKVVIILPNLTIIKNSIKS